MNRAELVLGRLSPGYRKAVEREQARFEMFCHDHRLPSDREAVTLYLTELMGRENVPAARVRFRLGLLDVMARANGAAPWSHDARMRLFVRGLHARPGDSVQRRVPPLYVETVPALIDAIDLPGRQQLTDAALIVLAHHTRLRVCELRALRWEDVYIRRGQVTLHVQARRGTKNRRITVAATGGSACPAAALQRLYGARPVATGPVFDWHGTTTMYLLLSAIGYTAGWTRRPLLSSDEIEAAHERLTAPTARQARDRSIVLLAVAAHLKTGEVVSLRSEKVASHANGLVLDVPGRRNPVGVRRQSESTYCPVAAWERWCDIRARSHDEPAEFAYVQVDGEDRIRGDPMTVQVLNRLVHRAARAAGLDGVWGFGSLRMGAIRTEARHGTPTHVIATLAGLESLKSVELHQQREALLTNNVAAHLGL